MSGPRIGVRWTVCALLFVVTTINYVDRQVLGILAPTLQRELHWSESDYGDVVSWFSLVYAFGFLAAGRLLDRVGVRRGFAVAIVAWSVAAIGHAFARTAAGFSAARALLGLGESANFPGAIKTVAEWFPKRERALATGIFNAGTNTGAIVTPLVVPWIALTWGWQWAFIATGSLGFLWLALWLALYASPERHPRMSPGELAHIRSDRDENRRPVLRDQRFRVDTELFGCPRFQRLDTHALFGACHLVAVYDVGQLVELGGKVAAARAHREQFTFAHCARCLRGFTFCGCALE